MRFFQRVNYILGISVLALLISAEAFGQTSAPSTGKKEPRKQTISFDDELVEGSTQKPELFYLFQKKNFNYKRLIKLRENFVPEAKRSTEDIQRGRGSN